MRLLSLVLFGVLLSVNTFTARVIRIIDGDSIEVLNDRNERIYVRLEGIDCPEKIQAFGNRAKQFTADLCFGKIVRVEQTGKDRYSRMLANVYVGNVCVNKELIRLGMAWHFRKYNHDPELARLEKKARAKKVGLWSQRDAVPPWTWRKKKNN